MGFSTRLYYFGFVANSDDGRSDGVRARRELDGDTELCGWTAVTPKSTRQFAAIWRCDESQALLAEWTKPRGLLTKPSAIRRMSETDDRQKARTACTIGTQPVIPAVYGVKAPL